MKANSDRLPKNTLPWKRQGKPNKDSIMTFRWTEKHLQYCIAQRLTPSARDLYEYLVLEDFEGKPQVLDLREFNKYVEKRRGQPYDRRTIKAARIFLEEKGLLTNCKKFTAFVYHVTLRAVSFFFKPKKHSDRGGRSRSLKATLQPSSGSNADERDITTTTIPNLTEEELGQLEESIEACKEAGICYHPQTAIQVLAGYSIEEVKAAIAYTLPRATSNVEGYLRMCLENEWWKRASRPASLVDVFALIYQQLRGQNE